MFYLIVAILIVSYYFFMAPKTIRSTLNMIGMVGAVALLLVLAAMSFVKIMQSPPEIFLGLAMVALGFFAIRDVYRLPSKKDEKSIIARKAEGTQLFSYLGQLCGGKCRKILKNTLNKCRILLYLQC